jgi:hypothetical protein
MGRSLVATRETICSSRTAKTGGAILIGRRAV